MAYCQGCANRDGEVQACEQRIKELQTALTRIAAYKHTNHCECSCEGDTEREIAAEALAPIGQERSNDNET